VDDVSGRHVTPHVPGVGAALFEFIPLEVGVGYSDLPFHEHKKPLQVRHALKLSSIPAIPNHTRAELVHFASRMVCSDSTDRAIVGNTAQRQPTQV
jgi:hypothetical protein